MTKIAVLILTVEELLTQKSIYIIIVEHVIMNGLEKQRTQNDKRQVSGGGEDMIKRDEGTYVVEKVFKPGKERCWCDQCSKEINKCSAKTFALSPEVSFNFDQVHFCDFSCMHNWVNGDGSKKLKRLLEHEERSEQEICICVKDFEELVDLMN